MHIVPLLPDVLQARASSIGVDPRPTMPGTVVKFRMPSASYPLIALSDDDWG